MFKKIQVLVMFLAVAAPLGAAERVSVDIYYPKFTPTQQKLILTGDVEAKQHADLAPLQHGVVKSLYVDQGQQVTAGQKLLQLDSKLAELALTQAEAELAAGKTSHQEAKRLFEEMLALSHKQLVAQSLLEERRAVVALAEAELSRLQAGLALQREIVERHTLYAPFAGVIAERHVDVGEWVTVQTRVFTLSAQQDLRIALEIPQEYYERLRHAENVDVSLLTDAVDSANSQLKLSQLVTVVNQNSRTLTALIDLPRGTSLLAGMSAQAEIALPLTTDNLVWLPKSALKRHPDGGTSVFSVNNERVKRHLVQVVKSEPSRVAVRGVPEGQPVAIRGVELLNQNMSVEVKQISGDAP
ncbi:efflux RND transporter periplasmic adaptor subunit [Neiella marina]|uniref:Efflux RND transporter periplasmic adaptor subunit n=1 Tax=Neiella holothuriorum TaxID=2870530 RepID=A0ABS7EJC8_9GAMM|nr:efflux RND transporter periplasmic adaptor subunit [Neiella holothuriorum]MBW8192430.1 efflux RND transporter periplasmic adaptor subunit [Neiella holothuriorum]